MKPWTTALAGLLAAASLAPPAAAQLSPLAPEAQVNVTPLHTFAAPLVAFDAAGAGELAVWLVPVSPAYSEVWARAFDRGGRPAGPEQRIDTGSLLKQGIALAALPAGGYAVAWTNMPASGTGAVSLRRVAANGSPAGSETRIDTASGTNDGTSLRVPALTAGLAASWSEPAPAGVELVARRFDAAGQPLAGTILLATDPACPIANAALAGLDGGGFSALWNVGAGTGGCPGFEARRFDAEGRPAVPIFPIAAADLFAIRADGSYLAVRNKLPPPDLPVASGYDVYVRLYDLNAVPRSAEIRLNTTILEDQIATAAVAAANGGFLVAWSTDSPATDDTVDADVFARRVDANGVPLARETLLNSHTQGDQSAPQAAADGHGVSAVSWVSEAPGAHGGDLFLRLFSDCAGGACLADRFQVEVAWNNPRDGSSGSGTLVPLTADTAAFWFFAPTNLELMVKTLDGRGVNGHFWVFYASLSDVEFTITVTDTATGAQRSYHNPPFTLASHADTAAF